MKNSLSYASVPNALEVPPEVSPDGVIQTDTLPWRRLGLVAGLVWPCIAMILMGKLPADGVAQEWEDNEWEILVGGNTTDNGSDYGSGNGSDNNTANDSAGNESTNESNTADCGGDWQGCLDSKCCKSETFRCYKKNDHWAQCKTICTPGIDPHDQQTGQHVQPWSCDDWDSTPNKCAGSWEGCLDTKCCTDKRQICFKKNDQWAQCRTSCKPGIDEHDRKLGKHLGNWSCEKFDDTPPPANCSADVEENCMKTRCCSNPQSTCFKKDDGWAACNETCEEAICDKDPIEHRRPWKCDLV